METETPRPYSKRPLINKAFSMSNMDRYKSNTASPHIPTQGSERSRSSTSSSDLETMYINMNRERVILNVGGKKFETFVGTLTKYPDSVLGAMFHQRNNHLRKLDSMGEYVFDRCPKLFEAVLNFYRTGKLRLTRGMTKIALEEEADFWQLPIDCFQEDESLGTKFAYTALDVTRKKAQPILTTIKTYIIEIIEKASNNGVQSFSIEFKESQQQFYAFLSNFSHRELILHDLILQNFDVSFNDMTSVQGHSYILFVTLWNRFTRPNFVESVNISATKILEEIRQGVEIKTTKDDHIITTKNLL